jgi:hypothetical protein
MPSPGTGYDPAMQPLVDQAIADLAERLGIVPAEIQVLSAEAVTWPDSSLGCPQPGMAYAEVLAPGYLIKLSAEGNVFEYHASRGSTVFYCENPSPPVPGTPADA